MAPMAIRMRPDDVNGVNAAFGLRTGPRLSAPLRTATSAGFGPFRGDQASFNLEQWSAAYDLVFSKAITETTSLFLGGQGEIYYPVPLPGYGLYGGVSQFHRIGKLGIGPAVTVRGATDFGIGVVGGPGSILGAEASCSVGYADEALPFAIVPFYGMHAVWAGGKMTPSQYLGAAVAMQMKFRMVYFEVSGGFGRVFQDGVPSWNAPIIGLRVGH